MAAHEAPNFADDIDPPPPKKRPRIQENPPACLDSLNDDCLLSICSYLPTDDLNSVAICSRRYRNARAHESLDQTRTGTIVISEGTTMDSLARTIIDNDWNQVFQGNRVHLTMEGIERLSPSAAQLDAALLSGVTSLSLSSIIPNARARDLNFNFASLFPNLTKINLSAVNISYPNSFCRALFQACRELKTMTWKGSEHWLDLNGIDFCYAFHKLQLYLDNSRLLLTESVVATFSETNNTMSDYAFRYCRTLERLSIKNATFRTYETNETHPISQEMLIKMVRLHPTLKWLRSDLSQENIAMLRQERPEMTFVSE